MARQEAEALVEHLTLHLHESQQCNLEKEGEIERLEAREAQLLEEVREVETRWAEGVAHLQEELQLIEDQHQKHLDQLMDTAVHKGYDDIVKQVITNGADVEAISTRDDSGRRPLHSAAARGHAEVTQVLLQEGADLRAKDNYGDEVIHIASQAGHAEVVDRVLDADAHRLYARNGRGWTAAQLAAAGGHIEVLEVLLRRGQSLDATFSDGKTLLHYTAANHRLRASEWLLTHNLTRPKLPTWRSILDLKYAHIFLASCLVLSRWFCLNSLMWNVISSWPVKTSWERVHRWWQASSQDNHLRLPEVSQTQPTQQEAMALQQRRRTATQRSIMQQGKQETQQGKQETQQRKQETQQRKQETQQGKQETQQGKQETQQGKQETQQRKQETQQRKQETQQGKQETQQGKQETQQRKQETQTGTQQQQEPQQAREKQTPRGKRPHTAGPSIPHDNKRQRVQVTPRGLPNLGNTCYMNSILQCLYHTRQLTLYLSQGTPRDEVNLGKVTRAYQRLLQALTSGTGIHAAVSQVKVTAGQLDDLFEGNEQREAHDFLAMMVQWLNDEAPPAVTATVRCGEAVDERSVISALFHGDHRSHITCQRSGKVICEVVEPFSNLSLAVSKPSRCQLTELLRNYYREQEILWECGECGSEHQCSQDITISRLPQHLILHLSRYNRDNPRAKTEVVFPADSLNLEEFVTSSEDRGRLYQLYGVCTHRGTMAAGHYTAFCRSWSPPEGRWFHFDDDRVELVTIKKVLAQNKAHILFYKMK
ncbi:uncharacterized protein [Panulirus ornatus]|uniref:uncharacterized protein isoform X1 n=1 Tax=Panulirus ornatus TaxID=150431 RepID=UPI003A8458C3